MKTYKEKTIAAINELIERYLAKEPNYKIMFKGCYCPFCKIYPKNNICLGCFMDGSESCDSTYCMGTWRDNNDVKALQSKERTKWHIANLPYLEKIPAKYFTPSKWRDFDKFMPKGWRDRILGENEEMKNVI